MIHQLVYASAAVQLFNELDLKELLENSRINNQKLDITGMLLYKDGNFIQLLEGEKQAVWELHNKISKDPRHDGMLTLIQETKAEREFPNWAMGFRNLTDKELRAIPNYSEFMNVASLDSDFFANPSRGRILLNTFKTLL